MRKTKQNITVPLIVDAVRNFDELEMVRCLYFSIETDLPHPDWHLSLGKFQIPVILVGISAIIVSDSSTGNVFSSKKRVDDFFRTIEEDLGLTVSTNDIWFPKSHMSEDPKPNSLFRVGLPLFLEAYKKRTTETPWEPEIAVSEKPLIIFKRKETEAFLNWTREQVEIVKKKSNEHPQNKLKNRIKHRRGM
jgi:hypothetical protein